MKFSSQILTLDVYQEDKESRHPIVRAFGPHGTTSKSCCVHIKGAFPYLFVLLDQPALDSINPPKVRALPVLIQNLSRGFQTCLEKTFKSRRDDREFRYQGSAPYVHSVEIVKGIPYYGYHSEKSAHLFFKICMYDPKAIGPCAALLRSGLVAGHVFVPYESHVPFLLQFLADYGLSGMSRLMLRKYRIRPKRKRQSTCFHEIDAHVSDIVNQEEEEEDDDEEKQDELSLSNERSENISRQHAADASTMSITRLDVTGDEDRAFKYVPSLKRFWKEEKRRREMFRTISPTDTSAPHPSPTPSRDVEKYELTNEQKKYRDLLERMIDSEKKTMIPSKTRRQQNIRIRLSPSQRLYASGSDDGSDNDDDDNVPLFLSEYIITKDKADDDNDDDDGNDDNETEKLLMWMQQLTQDIEEDNVADVSKISSQSSSLFSPDSQVVMMSQDLEEEGDSVLHFPGNDEDQEEEEEDPDEIMNAIMESQAIFETQENQILDTLEDVVLEENKTMMEENVSMMGENETMMEENEILPIPPSSSLGDSLASLDDDDDDDDNDDDTDDTHNTKQKVPRRRLFQSGNQRIEEEILRLKAKSLPDRVKNTIFSRLDELKDFSGISSSDNAVLENQATPSFSTQNDSSVLVQSQSFATPAPLPPVLPTPSPTSTPTLSGWWTPTQIPPSPSSVHITHSNTTNKKPRKRFNNNQDNLIRLSGPLKLMSIEILCSCRPSKLPDPSHDCVCAAAYTIYQESTKLFEVGVISISTNTTTTTTTENKPFEEWKNHSKSFESMSLPKSPNILTVTYVKDEVSLYKCLVDKVQTCDPDVLLGFDVERESLGYLLDRTSSSSILSNESSADQEYQDPTYYFAQHLSRCPKQPVDSRLTMSHGIKATNKKETEDEKRRRLQVNMHNAGRCSSNGAIWLSGRVVLNLWRMMRKELTLHQYTLDTVCREVLGISSPSLPCDVLYDWWENRHNEAISYICRRTVLNIRLLQKLDTIDRNCEYARFFGMPLYDVLSRGSQYRVESVMIRITKPMNFVLRSPSREQVAAQPGIESVPLVMEPVTKLYRWPVAVLDFRSLYPSVIIAHNMCFSTCVGRIDVTSSSSSRPSFFPVLGVDKAPPHPSNLDRIVRNGGYVSSKGQVFVPPSVRLGILPRMLSEILRMRVQIKRAAKECKARGFENLRRVMHSRQLSLKMIANVTYGYCAASFSGRMPCADIADAIVETGRDALMRAIDIVRNNKQRWNARVVYGDTDSMFVEMVGSDMDDAFRIGEEIAEAVTSAMKPPIKLQLEKIYLPCMLFAKKRYAGMKYEKRNSKPEFEAKGIETVRRDGCGVVRRILKRTLMALFSCGLRKNKDDELVPASTLRRVRAEVEREWRNILSGHVSLRDLTFWKGVRLGTYKNNPPAAIVAIEMLTRDPRARPLLKERVPYVVLCGAPGSTYKSLVVHPRTLLSFERGRGFVREGGGRRINSTYYILNATLPPLHRALILVGIDVNVWYREMPRVYDRQVALGQLLYRTSGRRRRRASTIDHYVFSSPCLICSTLSRDIFCETCIRDEISKQISISIVTEHHRNAQRSLNHVLAYCARCSNVPRFVSADGDHASTHCDSITCPVFHRRLNLFSDQLYYRIALDSTLDW